VNSAVGQNEGSAKIFSFGRLAGLSAEDTLVLFGEHYRDVKNTPSGTSHANIRAFMKNGWAGVKFPDGFAFTRTTTEGCESVALLSRLASENKIWLVGGSIPELEGDHVYNTCLVFAPDGGISARHRKAHLFDIDVAATESRPAIKFKESDILSAGEELTLVDLPWCRAGIGICYDIRFPEYALSLRQHGAKLLIYPGAFNMTTGPAHWSILVQGRAVDTQSYIALASPARSANKDDYQAYGHSMLVSPWGEVKSEGEHEPGVWVTEVDPSEADRIRQQVPTSTQKRGNLYAPYAAVDAQKRARTV
jgi:omega-amidase